MGMQSADTRFTEDSNRNLVIGKNDYYLRRKSQ